MAKPKVICVLSGDGGVGKSVLTYNIGNDLNRRGIKAYYKDLDKETPSTVTQLAFLNAQAYDLSDPNTHAIDKSKITGMFDDILELPGSDVVVVLDFGAESSNHMLKYLESKIGSVMIRDYAQDIDFMFLCVVDGKGSYKNSADYAEYLLEATKGAGKRYIFCNHRYTYSKEQEADLTDLSENLQAPIHKFSLVYDNPQQAIDHVSDNMVKGRPSFNDKKRSIRSYYNLTLDEMNFPV